MKRHLLRGKNGIGIQLSSGHRAERISNGMQYSFFIYFFFIKPPEIFFLFVILFQCKFADTQNMWGKGDANGKAARQGG